MMQGEEAGIPRQRAVIEAQERKRETEMEEARRQEEIAEASKKKWHATRNKPLLSGTIRQQVESPSMEAGGPPSFRGRDPRQGAQVSRKVRVYHSQFYAIVQARPRRQGRRRMFKKSQAIESGEHLELMKRASELAERKRRTYLQACLRGVDPTLQEMDQLELGQHLSSVKGHGRNLRRGKQSRLSMWNLWTQAREEAPAPLRQRVHRKWHGRH